MPFCFGRVTCGVGQIRLDARPRGPSVRLMVVRLALAACLALGWTGRAAPGGGIPDRPEKLSYPPLSYEPPDPASFRVELKAGPIAYVAPDRELPLVNISVLVRVGSYLDPAGKEGLAGFTGALLTRGGIRSKAADDLDERLAFLAANLNSAVGEDSGSVTLNLLSKDLDEGLALLHETLAEPRFQADKLELQKDQALQAMRERNDDSSAIEHREVGFLANGENFWANRHSTADSVQSITTNDLREFHRRWFHPANFIVAVNGDFERADMIARLEKFFSDWPYHGDKPPAIPTNVAMAAPGVYVVNKDVNQGRVTMLLPGVRRDDPDFPAVLVMNDILGGGGFTSRIMNRVRSDEGLAYGAGSAFPGGVYYPIAFHASYQSKSRSVSYAAKIVIEEMNRITSAPVSAEELDTAKRSFIDTFPETFNTKGKVAAQFARDEFTGRYAAHPDFWSTWRRRIAAVTAEDVQKAAKDHLKPDQVRLLVVGQKEEILKGDPNHPVSLPNLGGGKLTDVPLRDPLTMKPMAPAAKDLPKTQ